jgi:hypothetical protein
MTLQGIAAGSRANGSSIGYGSLGRGHINTMNKAEAQQQHEATKARMKRYMSGDYS